MMFLSAPTWFFLAFRLHSACIACRLHAVCLHATAFFDCMPPPLHASCMPGCSLHCMQFRLYLAVRDCSPTLKTTSLKSREHQFSFYQ